MPDNPSHSHKSPWHCQQAIMWLWHVQSCIPWFSSCCMVVICSAALAAQARHTMEMRMRALEPMLMSVKPARPQKQCQKTGGPQIRRHQRSPLKRVRPKCAPDRALYLLRMHKVVSEGSKTFSTSKKWRHFFKPETMVCMLPPVTMCARTTVLNHQCPVELSVTDAMTNMQRKTINHRLQWPLSLTSPVGSCVVHALDVHW